MAISQAHTRLSTVRAISLDLDGVVYQGKHLLPGAGDAIVRLREMGLKVYFVTNSSGKTREDLAARLRRLGVAADADDVLASSYASGVIINRITGGEPRSVLAIGADGLRAELSLAGLRIVDSAPCDFLVVGLDKFINYEKIDRFDCFQLYNDFLVQTAAGYCEEPRTSHHHALNYRLPTIKCARIHLVSPQPSAIRQISRPRESAKPEPGRSSLRLRGNNP